MTPDKTIDKTMHTRLETLFSSPGLVTHLDLNGLLCDVDPDDTSNTLFSSVFVGTSTQTLREEYAGFVASNNNPKDITKYCTVCLYRLEKKLA